MDLVVKVHRVVLQAQVHNIKLDLALKVLDLKLMDLEINKVQRQSGQVKK
jgi:hypothetical protein